MSALDLIPTENASRQVINSIGHWHPASRPDTFTQTNSDAEEIQSHQHTPVTTGDLPEAAQDLEDFNLEDAPDAVQARVAPETRQEKDQHEQENQHDALQNPQRHEVDDHVPAPRVVPWAANRASTLTFEIPDLESDEDEERLDPAWGIKRTDSVQILQGIDRSTSFPAFEEQMEMPESAQNIPLPHSQAEDIMHHLDLETVTAHEHEVIRSPMLSDDAGNEDWARSANDYIEDIMSRVVEPQSAIDKEIRFEEGLPLISTDNQMEDEAILGQEDHLARSNPFAVPEEESSFFDKLDTQHHHVQIPPPLDRKTTADVLDHLGSHPNDPSDSPVRESSKMATLGIAVAERPEARHGPQTSAELYEPSHGTEDPWAAALDDEEFLVDDDDDLLPDSAPESPSSFSDLLKGVGEPDEFLAHLHEETSLQRTPPTAGRGQRPEFTRAPSSNPYAPHQPSTSDLAQLSPTTYGNIGFSRPALAPMNSFQQQLQQRPVPPQKTESFVDQKGGYKSPYDLPMEIAKPRKRQSMQPVVQPVRSMPPPPPRTSSMTSSQGLQSPFSPTFPPGQGPVMPPPSSRPGPRSPTVARPSKAANPAKSSFFEELPVTSRPRPATGQGRYTPQQNPSIPPPQLLPRSPPQMPSQPSPPQARADPYAQYQLRAPEKLDPYANVPLQVPSAPVNPVINTRYSPNPTAAVGALRPSPSPRYSPVPPPQAAAGRYAAQAGAVTAGASEIGRQYAAQPVTNTQPPQANLPFQPRTSSPLAYMGRSISDQAQHPTQQRPAASQFDLNTLPTRHAPQNVQNLPAPPSTSEQWLPRRPQTQSPGGTGVPPSLQAIVNGEFHRPASVPGPVSPTRGPPVEIAPPARPSVRQRGMTGNFSFIEPTDGQERDELHRWKGAPIFNFAFGGSVVSSFPKHVPRYGMGSAAPMIKPSAGEVHVRNAIQVIHVPEHITTFPGPLRSKSKKREVLAWLKIRITALEETHLYRSNQIQQPDPHNRHDEKVLLWKIVQALVEHDGVLDGSPASQKAVSAILSPEVHSLDDASATQYGKHNDASGIYRPTGSNTRTEMIDADAVESVRKQLIRGEREAAVWIAVDKRLWSHALLIASTLEPTVWKQVVQEFVRQEVKTIGNNIEPLAALYEVFAGNFDESIDELVPPSARAGLRMVSKVDDSGPTKNALDGLDRWRETLSLVLNNRTNNDSQALIALGKLLIGYGRIEAAHICHLSARSSSQPALFAGADEPQAGVVLLGADHHSQPTEFFQDEDAILLTEIYEFAVTVLASNPTASMPYLQAYKLQRASLMADSGHKAEAQAYCEAISASFKATTKMSPYYNPTFFAVLEELTSRLKQIPIQSSSSWAKPSVEKVTNSLFNRLGNFIAGDDSDAESKGSGKDVSNEFGPFANVAGTPSLSREGSSSDLYGNYPVGVPIPTTTAGSRYAPGSINTARSSSELARGRPSLDSQRSPPSSGRSQMPRPNPYEQSSSFTQTSYLASQSNMYQPMSQSPPINRYQATPPQTSYMPQVANESPQRSYMPQRQDSYVPTPPPDPVQSAYIPTPLQEDAARTAFGGYASPEQHVEPDVQQQLQSNGYEASAQSYGAFEPSSGYVPYEPELDSPEQKTDAPKKKSYMDDDEDDSTRVTNSYAPQSQPTGPVSVLSGDDAAVRKRANDAAADAAFRAVAEADAARAKDQTLKPKASGWFSVPKVPFFGGKQDDSLDSRPVAKGGEPTVYRAKLGEAKMKIYYDEKLKKWINPDNPDSAQAKAPPPPPMRGPTPMSGPPRVLTPSATMPNLSSNGTGSGPPSRVATPVDNVSGDRTLPPSGLAGGLAPPSRPATGLSNASSLDDLIGPATGRRTVKGKKGAKGRYIDVMAK